MSKPKYIFSTIDEYYTPKEVVSFFGKFDFDPATTSERAEYLEIESFCTMENCGLKADWSPYKRIWINPPFTRKKEFVKKAKETYDKNGNEIYLLVSTPSLQTKWFWDEVDTCKIFMPIKRFPFYNPRGIRSNIPFGVVIIKFQQFTEIEVIRSWQTKDSVRF